MLKQYIPLLCGEEGKEKKITLKNKEWENKRCINARLATNEPGSVNSLVASTDISDDSDDIFGDLLDSL